MAHSQAHYSRHVKPLVKLIDKMVYRRTRWEVFCDFIELTALSISLCNPVGAAKRLEQVQEIKARYSADDLEIMQELITVYGEQAGQCFEEKHLEDILGSLYMEMDLGTNGTASFSPPCR